MALGDRLGDRFQFAKDVRVQARAVGKSLSSVVRAAVLLLVIGITS